MADSIKRFCEKKIRNIIGGPRSSRFFLGAERGARAWYEKTGFSRKSGPNLISFAFSRGGRV